MNSTKTPSSAKAPTTATPTPSTTTQPSQTRASNIRVYGDRNNNINSQVRRRLQF